MGKDPEHGFPLLGLSLWDQEAPSLLGWCHPTPPGGGPSQTLQVDAEDEGNQDSMILPSLQAPPGVTNSSTLGLLKEMSWLFYERLL